MALVLSRQLIRCLALVEHLRKTRSWGSVSTASFHATSYRFAPSQM